MWQPARAAVAYKQISWWRPHVKMQAWSRRRSQVRVPWRQLGTWYRAEQNSCSVSAPANAWTRTTVRLQDRKPRGMHTMTGYAAQSTPQTRRRQAGRLSLNTPETWIQVRGPAYTAQPAFALPPGAPMISMTPPASAAPAACWCSTPRHTVFCGGQSGSASMRACGLMNA